MTQFVKIKCRQTGFRAQLPVADWEAYTQEQRDAYEVESAPPPAARRAKADKES